MPTITPSESALRDLLKKLLSEKAIHTSAQESANSRGEKRTDDLLIAEVSVAIAWVRYLLGENTEEDAEYMKFLPRS